jgi:ATP-dependent DNA helicase RecG
LLSSSARSKITHLGRIYHLSAGMYRQLGHPAGYVRAHGISAIRQEAMVLEYVAAHGRIECGQVMATLLFAPQPLAYARGSVRRRFGAANVRERMRNYS